MKSVLVVEDDPFMAYDLAEQLAGAGLHVVEPAHTADEALALLAADGCDVGVLDVNLGRGSTSEPIALELKARAIPFVVVSGYASGQHPPILRGSALVTKPARIATLLTEIRRVLAESL